MIRVSVYWQNNYGANGMGVEFQKATSNTSVECTLVPTTSWIKGCGRVSNISTTRNVRYILEDILELSAVPAASNTTYCMADHQMMSGLMVIFNANRYIPELVCKLKRQQKREVTESCRKRRIDVRLLMWLWNTEYKVRLRSLFKIVIMSFLIK